METVASYFDGSGNYTVTRQGNLLSITLSDSEDVELERFNFILTRAEELDSLSWADYELTERFAFNEDDSCCRIDGEGFKALTV